MGRRLFFFVIVPLVLVTGFFILDPQLATDRFAEFTNELLEPLSMSEST